MAYYYSPIGNHEIPTYTTTNALGQKVVSSGGVYKMNPYTGKLQAANVNYLSPDVGTYSWDFGNSSSSSSASSSSSLGNILNGSSSSSSSSTPSTATTAYGDAISTLRGGVDSAKAAKDLSSAHIKSADADLESARSAASGITDAIGNVNATAQSLSPYAEVLGNMGIDTANLGAAILNNDSSGGGLAAQYLGALALANDAALKVTPDRYVAQAAADVQGSFQNAQGQAERNLSRQGVSASSGAYGALQRQYATALATALAAAKTKARQTGLTDRLTALTNRAALTKDALTTGAALRQQGANNVESAAGIVQKQADLFATAGSLANTQASAFANIGNVEVSLGNLEATNEKVVQDAIGNVASMQSEMAKYYANLEIAKLPSTTTDSSSARNSDGTYSWTNNTSIKTH